jgi:hypothetical protein
MHHQTDQPTHAAKAREGAKQDVLLAQNIDMLNEWKPMPQKTAGTK